mgnify:CR=1 FL=1
MSGHGLKTSAAIPALSLAAALIFGSAALAQNAVRVGAPLPLTGPLSPEGVKQKEGYDLWAETANAKGGITVGGKTYKVEIVYVDYASNTPRAVQAAERLITDDKVNFLFSPFGSGAAKAASNVSEKYGIPTIAATASSRAGLRPGLQVSVRNVHAQRHADRAARRHRRQARRQREARRHPGAQRPVPAGDRRGDAEVGEEAQSRRRHVREIFHRHHGPRVGASRRCAPPSPTGSSRPATSTT